MAVTMLNLLAVSLATALLWSLAFGGRDYYNSLYWNEGLQYYLDDDNGLYDFEYGYLDPPRHNGSALPEVDGCGFVSRNGSSRSILVCYGTAIDIAKLRITSLSKHTFTNRYTESIIIHDCPFFTHFEKDTFHHLTELTFLDIQKTALNHMPDISKTKLGIIRLAGNAIKMDTTNYMGWSLPPTTTQLSLANNSIHWIPSKFISGPELRIVSLSYNQLKEIHPGIFGDIRSLLYLGVDGNEIRKISMNSLAPLWGPNRIVHLNISNNNLTYIQPGTFRNIKNLVVLELHRNELETIQPGVIHDLERLLHLDLHNNSIEKLTRLSFKNLPSLMELRLHSQTRPMTAIAFDAWENIGNNLRRIFIGSNALTSFPHAAFEDGYYPQLTEIYADNNGIENMTAYGAEAYPQNKLFLHARREKTFKPFSTYPNLLILILDHNYISHVSRTDLCKMPKLSFLNLGYNRVRDRNMDDDAFACVPALYRLDLGDNLIEYIPKSFSNASLVPSLEILLLARNAISYVAKGQLSNVKTLKILHLFRNGITTVEDGAFPEDIEEIELERNAFRFLHQRPFANLPKLHYLLLYYNRITYLPLNAFENSTSLQQIALEHNYIPEIRRQHFKGLTQFIVIYVNYNSLGWIEDGTFADMRHLQRLVLHNNKLTRIPLEGSFTDKTISTALALHHNWITVLPRGVFKNLICESLQLGSNPIITIEPYAFEGLLGKSLHLDAMPTLHEVYSYSFHGISVTSFHLTQCKIKTLPTRTFDHFEAVTLFLEKNTIEEIEPSAFYNVTVVNMYLGYNAIRSITHPIFSGGSKVTGVLGIAHNQLERLSRDAFGYATVAGFDASNNSLQDVPRAVLNRRLKVLNINNNLITVLPKAACKGLEKLRDLQVASNLLENIELGVFDNLTNLQSLNLASNRLRTLPEGLFNNLAQLESLHLTNNPMTHLHMLNNRGLKHLYAAKTALGTLDAGAFSDLPRIKRIYLDQGTNGSLECTCGFMATVNEVVHRNVSGTCGYNEHAKGSVLAYQQGFLNFYLFAKAKKFYCSASNVRGEVLSPTEISVSFNHPDAPYVTSRYLSGRRSLSEAPPLSGRVHYIITCRAPYSPDLVAKKNRYLGYRKRGKTESNDETGIPNANSTDMGNTNATDMANINATDMATINVTDAANGNSTESASVNVTGAVPANTTDNEIVNATIAESANATEGVNGIETENDELKFFKNAHGKTLTVNFTAADGVRPGTTYECSIVLVHNFTTISARSAAVVLTTPDDKVPPDPSTDSNTTGFGLDVVYHDFSTVTMDFDDLEYIPYTNVTYVPSPYGAWLAASDTPELDTFSSWFRDDPKINIEFNDSLFLEEVSPTLFRFWSADFFPIDGKGFRTEGQRDCHSTYHNFGFTSAIRTSFIFDGQEVITVAGGEGLWLFINKIKVVEYTSVGEENTPCFVVDLTTAAYHDGHVDVTTGVLSNGSCTTPNMALTEIPLELEVGITYHLDLFHAETKTCSSEFLLMLENMTLSQNTSDRLPLDYTADVDEDAEIGDAIATVNIADMFDGETFNVTLYSGNEDRRFTLTDIEPPPRGEKALVPEYTEIKNMDGNVYQFVECTENATANVTATYNTTGFNNTAEEFYVNATTVYIILVDKLDMETVAEYYLQMSVVDTAKESEGFVAVRIKVADVNDNCPVITSVETFIPQPTLRKDPILTINSVDIDSGRNRDIRYIVSAIIASPAIEYDSHLDLWKDIYVNFTTLTLDVVAIDNGTIPRGTKTPLNISLSNTCVLDAKFGKIDIRFDFNDSNHELTLRIPKYYMFDYDCEELAGLSTGHVPDDWITASSTYHPYRTSAVRGRLHEQAKPFGNQAGAWVAGILDSNQYLQVDMAKPYRFKKVHIQGRADADEWVTSFKIWYDAGNDTWVQYSLLNGNDTFIGNTDRSTVVVHLLDPIIVSRRIRLNPQTWNVSISLRAEFTGCSQVEQLYYDASCIRCETTFYCLGDGERHMCGRCEDNSTVCDRDPIEHSFGLASQCSPCPSGWSCVDGYATPCPLYHYTKCYNDTCAGECTHCEPGFACNNGTRTVCKPGTYSDGNKKICAPCKPGTYQDLYAQGSCKPCAPGYASSGYGKISCVKCRHERYSNGIECLACTNSTECPCLDPQSCFDKRHCYNTGAGAYECACPAGYTGDGQTCTDIDECAEYNPCYLARCINTVPGYQCLECPDGYTGTYEDAYSWVRHRRVFMYRNEALSHFPNQTCRDIDECATNNGGCGNSRLCVNTEGSFYCGYCKAGYIPTDGTECVWADFAASGNHGCASNAIATYIGPGRYKCDCKTGYAGNGRLCGLDTDMDGFPDLSLPCKDWGCSRDNCLTIPNSMQEDPDGDKLGNACDADDDNDRFPDHMDNCPTVYNRDQSDKDGDGYGDVCDNCPSVPSDDQTNSDGDLDGNICDDDDDDDGFKDNEDNCPTVVNDDQLDTDGDGVGDACDNCKWTANSNQNDGTGNWFGNACDGIYSYEIDYDGDGILNDYDNCLDAMNSEQTDSDGDDKGDACDIDMDNDGVLNNEDNCPLRWNQNQADVDMDSVGDECESDYDNDNVDDEVDTCPKNNQIHETSFDEHLEVDFRNFMDDYPRPSYKINGSEIRQTITTPRAHMLIGRQMYGDIEYQGTWYVTSASGDDVFGCVFGYRDNTEFYTVLWRRTNKHKAAWGDSPGVGGLRGLHIKLIDAWYHAWYPATARAIWVSHEHYWQAKDVWIDPEMIPWEPEVAYRWHVIFRPTVGYINLKVYQGTKLLVDSGPLYQTFLTGGHVGVIQWGEFPMIWSNIKVTCLEHHNKALYLDGLDDYVELDNISTLQMETSFTVEVWVKLDRGYREGPYPIFCSVENDVCLWIEGGYVHGRYGNNVASTSEERFPYKTWHSIIMRYSLPDRSLSIFIDGNKTANLNDVSPLNWKSLQNDTTMMIGQHGTDYFRGTIDEFRLYNLSVPDKEINNHIFLLTTRRQVRMRYSILFFRMEDSTNRTSLVNSGLLSSPTATLHGGRFETSTQQTARHKLQYPNRFYDNHESWMYGYG